MSTKEDNKVVFNRNKIAGETPIVVSEIIDKCLYSGFFGTLDSARMKGVSDTILQMSGEKESRIIIIDLSNVEIIDSAVSVHLIDLAKTLRLVGMDVIFCGIAPVVAQSITKTGIEISENYYTRNLKAALQEVFKIFNLELIKKND